MKITMAKFMKGLMGTNYILDDGIPQVAFIGRSNVGKSTTINAITGQNKLAITSSFPGRTQQINVFLINDNIYFLDLPGYGYARASGKGREKIQELIYWYFFNSEYKPKYVVVIIDAEIGPTKDDLEMLSHLKIACKNVIIVANKIDKIKKSAYQKQINNLSKLLPNYKIIPFSALKKVGVQEIIDTILG
ncbi:ribosome biogenesis GTP-binding protein YsxC [Candidatus Nomurabacteria bacterium]|nr:ribosome biogenesis GTP-binding protein YsxC [Candidatus Nomurabacteria bacterium]